MTAVVEDTLGPIANGCPRQVLEADALCEVPYRCWTATAEDLCQGILEREACDTFVGLGEHTILYEFEDVHRNSSSCNGEFDVVDRPTPDAIAGLELLSEEEWAETASLYGRSLGHSRIAYRVSYYGLDNCDPAACCSATLNGMSVGDGQIVLLKDGPKAKYQVVAARDADGDGEPDALPLIIFQGPVFTLEALCTDDSGNLSLPRVYAIER